MVSAGFAWAQAPAAPRDKLLLVTNLFDDTLSVFRLTAPTGAVNAKTIPTGKRPTEVYVRPDGNRAYVSNSADASVTVVDLASLDVIATITDPRMKNPDGMAATPDSKKLYLVDQEADRIFVVSTETNKVVKELPAGHEPRRVVFSPDGGTIYVSNEGGGISVLRASDDQLVATRKVGRGPRAMAFTPDGKTMLVGVIDDDAIAFVNTATGEIENTIGGVGNSPQRVVVAPNGQSALVVSRVTHTLHLVDLAEGHRRALRKLQVGQFPMGLELSDPPNYAYVAVSGENKIAIVDLRTLDVLRVIPTGKNPLTVAVRR